MKKQFLEIGKITKLQGLKGEVRMQCYCDSPDVIEEFDTLYLDKGKTSVRLDYARYLKSDVAVIKLEGVNTPEEAQRFIGKTLYMNRDDAQLPDDVWFIQDIIGLSVEDIDSGRVYGKVDEIYQNGGADVYSLRTPEGRQLMFPAIPDVLIKTDIDAGRLFIRPLPNLFEIYENNDNEDEQNDKD